MTARPSSSEFQASDSVASPLALKARIEMLRENILATIGPMQAALDASLAMAAIPSDAGMLHGLRQARASWKSISADAAELAVVHAALASVFRQRDTAASPATGAHDEEG
jgi:hypothetical protein